MRLAHARTDPLTDLCVHNTDSLASPRYPPANADNMVDGRTDQTPRSRDIQELERSGSSELRNSRAWEVANSGTRELGK